MTYIHENVTFTQEIRLFIPSEESLEPGCIIPVLDSKSFVIDSEFMLQVLCIKRFSVVQDEVQNFIPKVSKSILVLHSFPYEHLWQELPSIISDRRERCSTLKIMQKLYSS